jgi:hypothetical protein
VRLQELQKKRFTAAGRRDGTAPGGALREVRSTDPRSPSQSVTCAPLCFAQRLLGPGEAVDDEDGTDGAGGSACGAGAGGAGTGAHLSSSAPGASTFFARRPHPKADSEWAVIAALDAKKAAADVASRRSAHAAARAVEREELEAQLRASAAARACAAAERLAEGKRLASEAAAFQGASAEVPRQITPGRTLTV